MIVLILADIEDLHWNGGPGQADLLLSCGDVDDQVILEAAQAYSCGRIFAVKGNHDADAPFPETIIDLHLQVREYGNLRFGGLNGSWRYKPRGPFLCDQDEVEAFLAVFPPVDIFLLHNSPRGIHDREDGVHHGFEALNTYIRKAKPDLVIHGHQHLDSESRRGNTRIIGVHGHRLLALGRLWRST